MFSRSEYYQRIIKHSEAHSQENNQVLKENPDPSCIHCYPITEQPSEEFGRFWYFWAVYSLKGDSYTSITEKAFEKAKENKDNSVVLNQCFKLLITSIRYHEFAQESFEDLLNILKDEWSNYLKTDNWEIETSIKSGTNSRITSRKSSRRSSKASKMTRSNNNNMLIDTSSHDQSSPPKNSSNDPFINPTESDMKWAELMYKIYDDTEFITNYEDVISSEERTKISAHFASNSRYFEMNYEPTVIEAAHRRYYMLASKKNNQDYITGNSYENNVPGNNNNNNIPDPSDTLQRFSTTYQRTYDDDDDEGSVLNVSVKSDKAVKNYSGSRLVIHEELANRRRENVEDERRRNNPPPPDTGNELLNQLLLGFTNVLNAHTGPTRISTPKETRLVDFPTFKGGNQDPIEWLEGFQRACAANRVAENRMLDILPSYLKGTALTWFNQCGAHRWRSIIPTQSFVQLFQDHYCNIFRKQQWKHQLQNLKQRNGETIDEYVAEITELWKRIDPNNNRTNADKIAEFIEGLRPEFIVPVQSSMPKDIDEAINKALALETAYSIGMELSAYSLLPDYLRNLHGGFVPARTNLATYTPIIPTNAFRSNTSESVEEIIDRKLEQLIRKLGANQNNFSNYSSNSNNNNNRNNINNRDIRICRNCNRIGHIAKDCRQRNNNNYNNNNNNYNSNYNNNNNNNARTCFNCNKPGHMAKDCRANRNNNFQNNSNQNNQNQNNNNSSNPNNNNRNWNNQQNRQSSSGRNQQFNSSVNHLN